MTAFNAQAQVDATNTYVSHMQSQADAAIAKLTEQATSWSMTSLSAVAALTLSARTTAAGTKPSLTTLTLPTFTPSVFTALASPTLPGAPSLAGGTAPMWNEAFWANLKTRIATFSDTLAGSTGVDDAVARLTNETGKLQVALYAKDYERKTQTLRDLYSAADGATGAKGFSHPNSMTSALKMDAQQKFQFDMSQVSRDLITHIFDWAKSNWQFAVQQGVAAHGADVEFNTKYLSITIEAYRAQVTALVEKYRADVYALVEQADARVKEYVSQFNSELEKQKVLKDIQLKDAEFDVEVAKTNAGIVSEAERLKIEDFKARVENFLQTALANMKIMDENVKNKISAAAASAQACAAMAQAAGTITVNTAGA